MNRTVAHNNPRPVIAIADYDMGNRGSVRKALRVAGAEPIITRDADEIRNADALLLPGVGAYPAAMENIKRYGLDTELRRAWLEGKPLLGICLGHQLMFEASEEQR